MCISKKVLMVHPFRTEKSKYFPIISVGFIAIANSLIENGFSVVGVDIPLEYNLNEKFDFVKVLEEEKPDIVLISFHWYEFLIGTLYIAKETKAWSKDTIVIAGGMSATIFYSKLLEECKEVDYVVLGDAVRATVEICKSECQIESINNIAYRYHEKILVNERSYKDKIDDLNYVNISFLKHYEQYYFSDINGYEQEKKRNYWLCVGRGCPYNCLYCGGSHEAHKKIFLEDKYKYRSFDKVKKDIMQLKDCIDTVSLTHDIELLPYWRELIKFISSIGISLYFESFQLPSSNLVEYLNRYLEGRCTVGITAISGNVNVRKQEGKF